MVSPGKRQHEHTATRTSISAKKLRGAPDQMDGLMNHEHSAEYVEHHPPKSTASPTFLSKITTADHEEDSLERCGRHVSLLIEAVKKLSELGLDRQVLELPQLVLVGDQSAGKSSLMGALADIHLPKGTGTCTRCPAHVMTAPDRTWSCRISIMETYAFDAQSSAKISEKTQFPLWVPLRSPQTKDFKTIYDKTELLETMIWAQRAILNPTRDYRQYIPGSPSFCNETDWDDRKSQARFSPNVVRIDIAGPNLPSLSFVDLPGVISTSSDPSQRHTVNMILNLVNSYLRMPETIIICAISMNVDMEASRIFSAIQEADVSAKCIGVLTKPDIKMGSNIEWERRLRGEIYQLGHGNFITKLPQVEFSQTFDDDYYPKAREAEMKFFETISPFCDDWSFAQSRFGTRNLQEYLSRLLARKFSEMLPEYQVNVQQKILFLDAKLATLPELPSHDQLLIVTTKLREFGTSVRCSLEGVGDKNFANKVAALYDELCAVVVQMKPGLRVGIKENPIVVLLESDDESETTKNDVRPLGRTPSHKACKPEMSFTTPTTQRMSSLTLNKTQKGRKRGATYASCRDSGKGRWKLTDISNVIDRYSEIDLKGQVSPEAGRHLIKESIVDWDRPIEIFLQLVVYAVKDMIRIHLHSHLSQWSQTPLYREAKASIESEIMRLSIRQVELNKQILGLEYRNQFNLFQSVREHNQNEQVTAIRKTRNRLRIKDHLLSKIKLLPKYKASDEDERRRLEAEATTDEKIAALKLQDLPAEQFEREIDLAGYVRGYYITAARRFAETIVISTAGNFLGELADTIENFLAQKLGLTGNRTEDPVAKCIQLMEEDPGVVQQRLELLADKAKLIQSRDYLISLVEDLNHGRWDALSRGAPATSTFHPTFVEQQDDDMMDG